MTASTIDILDIPVDADNSAGATTIRGYLLAVLAHLWQKGDCFSGKYAMGDSDWQYEVYVPLIKAGIVSGTIDEDGCVDDFDQEAADRLIVNAIGAMQPADAPRARRSEAGTTTIQVDITAGNEQLMQLVRRFIRSQGGIPRTGGVIQ